MPGSGGAKVVGPQRTALHTVGIAQPCNLPSFDGRSILPSGGWVTEGRKMKPAMHTVGVVRSGNGLVFEKPRVRNIKTIIIRTQAEGDRIDSRFEACPPGPGRGIDYHHPEVCLVYYVQTAAIPGKRERCSKAFFVDMALRCTVEADARYLFPIGGGHHVHCACVSGGHVQQLPAGRVRCTCIKFNSRNAAEPTWNLHYLAIRIDYIQCKGKPQRWCNQLPPIGPHG